MVNGRGSRVVRGWFVVSGWSAGGLVGSWVGSWFVGGSWLVGGQQVVSGWLAGGVVSEWLVGGSWVVSGWLVTRLSSKGTVLFSFIVPYLAYCKTEKVRSRTQVAIQHGEKAVCHNIYIYIHMTKQVCVCVADASECGTPVTLPRNLVACP